MPLAMSKWIMTAMFATIADGLKPEATPVVRRIGRVHKSMISETVDINAPKVVPPQKDTEVNVPEREASLFEASGVSAAKASAGAPDGPKKQAIEAVPKRAGEENRVVKVELENEAAPVRSDANDVTNNVGEAPTKAVDVCTVMQNNGGVTNWIECNGNASPNRCKGYLRTNNNKHYTCNQFCASLGFTCYEAYKESQENAQCPKRNDHPLTCEGPSNDDYICGCEATPNPTAIPTANPTANPTPYPTATPTANPTANPTLYPTASPTLPPNAPPCVVSLFEHWSPGISSQLAQELVGIDKAAVWHGDFKEGNTFVRNGTGTFDLDAGFNGTSSVTVTGECCFVRGYITPNCDGPQPDYAISSSTQITNNLDGQPLPVNAMTHGVVTPAENLKKFWGCNDCARCIKVERDCATTQALVAPPSTQATTTPATCSDASGLSDDDLWGLAITSGIANVDGLRGCRITGSCDGCACANYVKYTTTNWQGNNITGEPSYGMGPGWISSNPHTGCCSGQDSCVASLRQILSDGSCCQ